MELNAADTFVYYTADDTLALTTLGNMARLVDELKRRIETLEARVKALEPREYSEGGEHG